jgi:hypothetical protein
MSIFAMISLINDESIVSPIIVSIAITIWFTNWVIWANTIGSRSTSRLSSIASMSRPCASIAVHI